MSLGSTQASTDSAWNEPRLSASLRREAGPLPAAAMGGGGGMLAARMIGRGAFLPASSSSARVAPSSSSAHERWGDTNSPMMAGVRCSRARRGSNCGLVRPEAIMRATTSSGTSLTHSLGGTWRVTSAGLTTSASSAPAMTSASQVRTGVLPTLGTLPLWATIPWRAAASRTTSHSVAAEMCLTSVAGGATERTLSGVSLPAEKAPSNMRTTSSRGRSRARISGVAWRMTSAARSTPCLMALSKTRASHERRFSFGSLMRGASPAYRRVSSRE